MSGLVINGVEVWRLLLLGLVIGLVGVAAAGAADRFFRHRAIARRAGPLAIAWVVTTVLLDGRSSDSDLSAAEPADHDDLFPGTLPWRA